MKIRIFYRNVEYVMDLENETERQDFKELFWEEYHQEFNWFKEETGDGRWVLYKVNDFEIGFDGHVHFLHYRGLDCTVEIPINCSSCFRMFEKCRFREPFFFDRRFNTDGVKVMDFMFCNVTFNPGFRIEGNFSFDGKTISHVFDKCKGLGEEKEKTVLTPRAAEKVLESFRSEPGLMRLF